jgi:hypothetical protein
MICGKKYKTVIILEKIILSKIAERQRLISVYIWLMLRASVVSLSERHLLARHRASIADEGAKQF